MRRLHVPTQAERQKTPLKKHPSCSLLNIKHESGRSRQLPERSSLRPSPTRLLLLMRSSCCSVFCHIFGYRGLIEIDSVWAHTPACEHGVPTHDTSPSFKTHLSGDSMANLCNSRAALCRAHEASRRFAPAEMRRVARPRPWKGPCRGPRPRSSPPSPPRPLQSACMPFCFEG
jgi:hypothetical protein